jgi:hypothetical protein
MKRILAIVLSTTALYVRRNKLDLLRRQAKRHG